MTASCCNTRRPGHVERFIATAATLSPRSAEQYGAAWDSIDEMLEKARTCCVQFGIPADDVWLKGQCRIEIVDQGEQEHKIHNRIFKMATAIDCEDVYELDMMCNALCGMNRNIGAIAGQANRMQRAMNAPQETYNTQSSMTVNDIILFMAKIGRMMQDFTDQYYTFLDYRTAAYDYGKKAIRENGMAYYHELIIEKLHGLTKSTTDFAVMVGLYEMKQDILAAQEQEEAEAKGEIPPPIPEVVHADPDIQWQVSGTDQNGKSVTVEGSRNTPPPLPTTDQVINTVKKAADIPLPPEILARHLVDRNPPAHVLIPATDADEADSGEHIQERILIVPPEDGTTHPDFVEQRKILVEIDLLQTEIFALDNDMVRTMRELILLKGNWEQYDGINSTDELSDPDDVANYLECKQGIAEGINELAEARTRKSHLHRKSTNLQTRLRNHLLTKGKMISDEDSMLYAACVDATEAAIKAEKEAAKESGKSKDDAESA